MAKTVDVVQQLHEAIQQRDSLAASLPKLTQTAEQTAANRRELTERLELKEGDTLIGKVTQSDLANARAKTDAAIEDARKAEAALRDAKANVVRLNDAIGRLMPEVCAVRGTFYRERHIELVEQLRDALNGLVEINDALHANFRDAETEFPYVTRRGGGTPYPPAAGLSDLSWGEFRHNAHSQDGGRLGSWLKRVAAFRDPDSVTPTAAPKRQSHLAERARGSSLDVVSAHTNKERGY